MELHQLLPDVTCASAPSVLLHISQGKMDLQSDLILPKY